MKRIAVAVCCAVFLVFGQAEAATERQAPDLAKIQKLAEQGDATAQFVLGAKYSFGNGVAKDGAKAEQWLQKAAAQGHAKAQHMLGLIYINGEGVAKDVTKGVQWLQKAAEQGDASAQHTLGIIYAAAEGDEAKAEGVQWLQKSAAQGNAKAQKKLEELAAAKSGQASASAQASMPPPTSKTYTNSIGMEFVLIPAGSFDVTGAGKVRVDDFTERFPKAIISKSFYLGKYEVTQEQWVAVMGSGTNPSKFVGRTNPVEQVSWNDAQEFIKRLNAKEGHNRYRLPTEMEWEHAAKGGTDTEYFFMKDGGTAEVIARLLSDYAWFNKNSGGTTHPVGQKKPNQYGLYDIYGNVWEWVQDWYGNFPANRELTDYRGPAKGSSRVFRGGDWFSRAGDCRSATRDSITPDYRINRIGFRLALSQVHQKILMPNGWNPAPAVYCYASGQKEEVRPVLVTDSEDLAKVQVGISIHQADTPQMA